jgi:hypothetical protein
MTYLTLYTGASGDRTFVPNSSASLESAAAASRSLMSLHPFSPQIRTQNSPFATAVGARSAASATKETSARRVRLTPKATVEAGGKVRATEVARASPWASGQECPLSQLATETGRVLRRAADRPQPPCRTLRYASNRFSRVLALKDLLPCANPRNPATSQSAAGRSQQPGEAPCSRLSHRRSSVGSSGPACGNVTRGGSDSASAGGRR